MSYVPENPLVVQGDHTVLLETMSPRYEEARDELLAFAELVKNPEYVHTWRITKLSLWNAAAAGKTADQVVGALERLAAAGQLAAFTHDGFWVSVDTPRDLARLNQLWEEGARPWLG